MVSFGVTAHLSWMNVKNAQKRTPGSVTFRSRRTRDGASSRNDAKRFANPPFEAVSERARARAVGLVPRLGRQSEGCESAEASAAEETLAERFSLAAAWASRRWRRLSR